jgi:hypothetical protein
MLPVGVDIFFIALSLSRIGWKGPNLCWLFAEVIGIRAVSGIGGLFRSHREILVETGLLRPVHGLHIGCDIPGFLDR